jgi:hypothetical protein
MRVQVRDLIAVAIFLVAGVVVRFGWHLLGPWASLGVAFTAAVAVVAVYRVGLPMRRPGPSSTARSPEAPARLQRR